MSATDQFVTWFREASPYIRAHRGRSFVIAVDGETVAGPGIIDLVHDLALLDGLGIRLVVVYGARPQIEERLAAKGERSTFVDGLRVSDAETMASVRDAAGAVRAHLEALLSQGIASSPMAGTRMRAVSGNFVTARPIGVRDGTDFAYTGTVRRIDTDGIDAQLAGGAVVLLGPIGYSPTGEVFNLDTAELAAQVATALTAAKLVYFCDPEALPRAGGETLRELTLAQLSGELGSGADARRTKLLRLAGQACRQGVQRVHLLDRGQDGALLQELFTRDGAGLMVSQSPVDSMRRAGVDDAAGIVELIRPLEEEGVLVRRSREKLEMEIAHFTVVERDGVIIGCGALLPYEQEGVAEVACIAVHPDYRRHGYGDSLLDLLAQDARRQGLDRLVVLTTQAAQWFAERGFEEADPGALPVERQSLYNYRRNSKVLVRPVDAG